MRHLKSFNEGSSLQVGDHVITNLSDNGPNGTKSPFHNVKGIIVDKTGGDYLVDLSINGPEFIKRYKDVLYTADEFHDFGGTHKWFEQNQLVKNNP